jgi:predicted AAA+ superfamily ATPase
LPPVSGSPRNRGKSTGLVVGAERSRLEHAFLEWLEVGGFPEAQDLDAASRRQLLRDYVDVAILRDVWSATG